MKAKKRVVTTRDARPAGSKRTPTVRRLKSAILPAAPRPAGARPSSPPDGRAAGALASALEPPRGEATVELAVDLGRGLVLANPVLAASGVLGYGVEQAEAAGLAVLGGFCTRGTTLRPRSGNRPPRMAQVAGGLINAVGLQNPGVEAVLERYGPAWAGWRVPVIVNLGAESVGDFVELVRRLEGAPGVAGVELNLSCPNAARGGQAFGLEADAASAVTAAVRRATDLPVLAKLSPNASDVRAVARAVEDAGADALIAVNTLTGLAVSRSRDAPLLGTAYGGLSGPALKPVALRVVYEVAQVVDVPVVAAGGVSGIDDMLDFLAAGAVAVQVGTAALVDPRLPARLVEELVATCRVRGVSTYRDLIGSALPRRPGPPSTRGAEYRP